MDKRQTLDVVAKLYDAALDPKLWPTALTALAHALNGQDHALFFLEKHTGQCPFFCSGGFPQTVVDEYARHYSILDPGALFARANPHLSLYHNYQWIDEADMDRHEFHNWLEKAGGVRYHLAAVVADTPELYGVASLQRTRRQGPAGEAEHKAYLHIVPHIRRAVRISREFAVLQTGHAAGLSALDRLSVGVLLLHRSAKPVFFNRAAETILGREDGLRLDHSGCLRAVRPEESAALARSIAAAGDSGAGVGLDAGAGHAITRPSGRRPYAVMVAPLGDRRDVLKSKSVPEVVIFITDPEARSDGHADLLRQACDLSPAEARLAAALVTGNSLKHYAEETALSINTVRWTLKKVLAKTDCRRQAELMKLLTSVTIALPSSTDTS